jgi:hypothetical protein
MSASRPRLNGFELLEFPGNGAFGEVWKARNLTLTKLRAIKIVAPARFREQDVRRLIAAATPTATRRCHHLLLSCHRVSNFGSKGRKSGAATDEHA